MQYEKIVSSSKSIIAVIIGLVMIVAGFGIAGFAGVLYKEAMSSAIGRAIFPGIAPFLEQGVITSFVHGYFGGGIGMGLTIKMFADVNRHDLFNRMALALICIIGFSLIFNVIAGHFIFQEFLWCTCEIAGLVAGMACYKGSETDELIRSIERRAFRSKRADHIAGQVRADTATISGRAR